MKITKSRACLMAYIISLAIVVILSGAIDNEQISRITFATTVAGLFFALSDYLSFVANDKKEHAENDRKRFVYIKAYLKTTDLAISNNVREAQKILDYFGEDCEVSKSAITILNEASELKIDANDIKNDISDCEQELEEEEKKSKKIEEISNWLLCMGFAFALVVVFLQINITYFDNISNLTTIFSFGIITSTYLLKDVGEEKRKDEVNKIKEAENYFNSICKRINDSKELIFKIEQIFDKCELENKNTDIQE